MAVEELIRESLDRGYERELKRRKDGREGEDFRGRSRG